MSLSRRITRTVDVDVEFDIDELLEDVPTEALIDTVNARRKESPISNVTLQQIYEEFRRRGDAPQILKDYIYETIGKIL